MPIPFKPFQKTEERTIPNLFYGTSTVLIPKADMDTTRKGQTNIPDKYSVKILNKILSNQTQ